MSKKSEERRDRLQEAQSRVLGKIDLSPLSPQEKSTLRYAVRMANEDLDVFSVEEKLNEAVNKLNLDSGGVVGEELSSETEDVRERLANEVYFLGTPIDFQKFIEAGVLKKIGRYYYVKSLSDLPKALSVRLSSTAPTKDGVRLTFTKEKKSMASLAEKSKAWRTV